MVSEVVFGFDFGVSAGVLLRIGVRVRVRNLGSGGVFPSRLVLGSGLGFRIRIRVWGRGLDSSGVAVCLVLAWWLDSDPAVWFGFRVGSRARSWGSHSGSGSVSGPGLCFSGRSCFSGSDLAFGFGSGVQCGVWIVCGSGSDGVASLPDFAICLTSAFGIGFFKRVSIWVRIVHLGSVLVSRSGYGSNSGFGVWNGTRFCCFQFGSGCVFCICLGLGFRVWV